MWHKIKVRTRIAEGHGTVSASCAITGDGVAVPALLAKQTASLIQEGTNDAADVGSVRCELAADNALQAAASSIVGSWRERGASEPAGVRGWAAGIARGTGAGLGGGRGQCDFTVLGLEAVEVIIGRDRGSVRRYGDHTELTLSALGREVAESKGTRPDVRHGRGEDGLHFSPETWRGSDATEFGEVGGNVVTCKVAVLACVHRWISVTAEFAEKEKSVESTSRYHID